MWQRLCISGVISSSKQRIMWQLAYRSGINVYVVAESVASSWRNGGLSNIKQRVATMYVAYQYVYGSGNVGINGGVA